MFKELKYTPQSPEIEAQRSAQVAKSMWEFRHPYKVVRRKTFWSGKPYFDRVYSPLVPPAPPSSVNWFEYDFSTSECPLETFTIVLFTTLYNLCIALAYAYRRCLRTPHST